jgi:DNA-binding response OmpR family regulator
MAEIIVVDDEAGIRAMLIEYLAGASHAVRGAADGQALRHALSQQAADLVLLDLNLPGEDGLSLARHLRSSHELGIVMLTGADGIVDRVVGLEIGADDYVTKPFSLPELAARIDAVLRRRQRMRDGRVPFGQFTLDLKRWLLLEPDGTEVPLSGTEIDLIAAFATNEGKVLSRDDISDRSPAAQAGTGRDRRRPHRHLPRQRLCLSRPWPLTPAPKHRRCRRDKLLKPARPTSWLIGTAQGAPT